MYHKQDYRQYLLWS